jgi:hypothetical protein
MSDGVTCFVWDEKQIPTTVVMKLDGAQWEAGGYGESNNTEITWATWRSSRAAALFPSI